VCGHISWLPYTHYFTTLNKAKILYPSAFRSPTKSKWLFFLLRGHSFAKFSRKFVHNFLATLLTVTDTQINQQPIKKNIFLAEVNVATSFSGVSLGLFCLWFIVHSWLIINLLTEIDCLQRNTEKEEQQKNEGKGLRTLTSVTKLLPRVTSVMAVSLPIVQ